MTTRLLSVALVVLVVLPDATAKPNRMLAAMETVAEPTRVQLLPSVEE